MTEVYGTDTSDSSDQEPVSSGDEEGPEMSDLFPLLVAVVAVHNQGSRRAASI